MLAQLEWPPAQGYVLLDQISTTLTMHLGHTALDMKEPLNVHEMINLASCCGRVARVLPIQMVDDLIETVRRSEVAWHAAVCLQRDVLAEGMPAHDMGLPDSQSSEELPISPSARGQQRLFEDYTASGSRRRRRRHLLRRRRNTRAHPLRPLRVLSGVLVRPPRRGRCVGLGPLRMSMGNSLYGRMPICATFFPLRA